ncbi:MAG: hypothetical protein COA58_03395 [Bacteroidetes bacterium]|nr:MAG: hypothetical protein COA58_03395 [Bacteroidota bacterium]
MQKTLIYDLFVVSIFIVLVSVPFIFIPRFTKNTSTPKPLDFCGTVSIEDEATNNFTKKHHLEKALGFVVNVKEGVKLFSAHCGSCHDYYYTVVGPPLAGLRKELGKQAYTWFDEYLENSDLMLIRGDKRSVEIKKKYGGIDGWNHTDSSFTDIQKQNLIGFILLLESK